MKTRIPLSVLCILMIAGAALAQPGGGRGQRGDCPPDGPKHKLERLAQRLDLSEEQQEAIRAIQEKSREKGLETRKEIKRLKNELEGLMLQDDPDAKAASQLIRKIGDLRTEQQVRRMETRLAVREQLTDEQLDKMLAMGPRGGKGRAGRHACGQGRDCGQGGRPGRGGF